MSDDYYKQELLMLVANEWPVERIIQYVADLEARILETQQHVRALRALIKRKNRNKNLKETGGRGGK